MIEEFSLLPIQLYGNMGAAIEKSPDLSGKTDDEGRLGYTVAPHRKAHTFSSILQVGGLADVSVLGGFPVFGFHHP